MRANSITTLDENAVICHFGAANGEQGLSPPRRRGKVASLFLD
jgi:hypothetical protein